MLDTLSSGRKSKCGSDDMLCDEILEVHASRSLFICSSASIKCNYST